MFLIHSLLNKSKKLTIFAHSNNFWQNIEVVNFLSDFFEWLTRRFLSFYSAYCGKGAVQI